MLDSLTHSRKHYSEKIEVGEEALRRMADISHNAINAISIFNAGLYKAERSKSLPAHHSFIKSFDSFTEMAAGIYYESQGLVERVRIPRTIEEYIKRSVSIYPRDEVRVEAQEDILSDMLHPELGHDVSNVIFNLVNNAWKYSSHRAVRKLMTAQLPDWEFKPVVLGIGRDSERIFIDVMDCGIPIPEDKIEALFQGERVNQVDGLPSTCYGMKSIMESIAQLGGTIDITTQVPPGYTKAFRVELPSTVIQS